MSTLRCRNIRPIQIRINFFLFGRIEPSFIKLIAILTSELQKRPKKQSFHSGKKPAKKYKDSESRNSKVYKVKTVSFFQLTRNFIHSNLSSGLINLKLSEIMRSIRL